MHMFAQKELAPDMKLKHQRQQMRLDSNKSLFDYIPMSCKQIVYSIGADSIMNMCPNQRLLESQKKHIFIFFINSTLNFSFQSYRTTNGRWWTRYLTRSAKSERGSVRTRNCLCGIPTIYGSILAIHIDCIQNQN